MRLLLVDDDSAQLQAFRDLLPKAAPDVSIIEARSLHEANTLIDSEFFDAAIVDLRLPPKEGEQEADVHGIAVVERIRTEFPGTPVLIFTGYGSMDLAVKTYGRYTQDGLPFGGKSFRLFEIITKEKLRDCFERVAEWALDCHELRDVELDTGAGSHQLNPDEKRILKAATRLFGSVRAEIAVLRGGLSDASTFRLITLDANGRIRTFAFAKVDSLVAIQQERSAFESHVAGSLRAGAFATFLKQVQPAGTRKAGLFYRLAEAGTSGRVTSVFDSISGSPSTAASIVKGIAELCRPWTDNVSTTRMKVSEIRRALIDDETFERLDPTLFAATREVEQRKVNFRMCSQHRDLHGENVLVQPDSSLMLIDFGLVREAPAGLDAVILELSLICHEKGRALLNKWPTAETADQWFDVDAYVNDGAPVWANAFVQECRRWGLAVAGGSNAYAACGYAFAVRQLRFADVDRTVIGAVARSCIRHLSES